MGFPVLYDPRRVRGRDLSVEPDHADQEQRERDEDQTRPDRVEARGFEAVLRKGMVMGNPESSENTMNTPPAMAAGPTHRIRTEIFIRLSSLLEAFMPPI